MKHKPFFVACLCLVFWAQLIAQAAPIATVRTSRGETFIRAKGKTQAVPLTVRKSLFAGDVVGTGPGGKLALLFSDGATVRLNEKTTIEITPSQGAGKSSLFRALGGELWARLRPGNTASTRTVALGVRGTEIFLQVAEGDGTTTLTVIEGEVEFFNPFGRVVVATSQQSTARPGQAPTMPITIPNAALIIEWSLDLEQALIPREKFFTTSEALRNRRTLNDEVLTWKRQAEAQPENIETQIRYGDALFDAGQFQEALALWQRVNEKAPRQPSTLTRVGYAHLELNELDEAQVAFAAALQNEPNHLAALIGNAQLQLARNSPAEAQQAAERAIAVDAKNAEANIALGLALMRQPAKQDQAKAAFEVAAQGEPSLYSYQAHSWLSLLALAQGQNDVALAEGLAATKQAPFSALARGNLALAYFYSGKAREAEREARIAAQLDADSPAARVALGQALLARGDVDAAARMAAQAVALDPQLAPAHYLLGIAGAQRRDYRHAVRDLQESLRLAPDFLPASAALARVYTRMDRKEEAITVLRIAQLRRPDNKDVLAALGEVHYEQANYAQAIDAFQQAIAQAPSALAYAGLAKVALDANRLDLAINAGQKAVQLAPQIAQYHAILAQAYTFSGLETQAQRELRTALALDPQNAFALAQFSAKLITGDERTTRRTQGTGFRQAFLLDPAISDQLERGGIDTQLTAQGGSRTHSGIALHRNRAFDGQLHFYGRAESRHDHENRANSEQRLADAYQELTYTLNPATNLYFNAIHNEFKTGLPGPATRPVLDDRARFRFNQGIIGARHRIGRQAHLWAGYLDTVQRNDRFNPGRDNSFRATPVDSTINVPQSLRRLETVS
ncbi:MAG TPA: tetratricopeptide repeat protein, partial [Abditibacteriaceae bacterium]